MRRKARSISDRGLHWCRYQPQRRLGRRTLESPPRVTFAILIGMRILCLKQIVGASPAARTPDKDPFLNKFENIPEGRVLRAFRHLRPFGRRELAFKTLEHQHVGRKKQDRQYQSTGSPACGVRTILPSVSETSKRYTSHVANSCFFGKNFSQSIIDN
jgi:hypothetical protein